jgi:hypothetical protein
MKRLLLLVAVSMLLAMWILSAWEAARAASSAQLSVGDTTASTVAIPVPTSRSTAFPFVHWDGKHGIPDQPDIDWDRFDADRHGRPAAGAAIFFDPIERRRLIR